MSVLVLPEKSPVPLRLLAAALEKDLKRYVQIHDGWLQTSASEAELFDAAETYLVGCPYYVTGSYSL